ncbi:MAG: hypothetical protein KDB04_02945 [Acidimicrobiales bacterium]|nr:hypothetical protein [Acidimicrobiales bacterium]HRW39387.1 hypothetical protein [Aquihabitans sp.]
MRSFNLCGWTSVLVPAFFVGFAVASLAGSDAIGWLAALATGLAVAASQARSGARASCAVPPGPADQTDRPTTARR